jgi:hypothetical protein
MANCIAPPRRKCDVTAVRLLLAGMFLTTMGACGDPAAVPVPGQQAQSANWTSELERYCRATKDKMDAIRRKQSRQPATRIGMQRGIRLEEDWGALETKLYDSCATNRQLWKYLRETW